MKGKSRKLFFIEKARRDGALRVRPVSDLMSRQTLRIETRQADIKDVSGDSSILQVFKCPRVFLAI